MDMEQWRRNLTIMLPRKQKSVYRGSARQNEIACPLSDGDCCRVDHGLRDRRKHRSVDDAGL
jgi:hypothetical protein